MHNLNRAVIDIHCHRECGAAAALAKPEADRLGHKPLQFGNQLTKDVNKVQLEYLRPKMESAEVRIADLDEMGVDIQALSVSPYHLFYWVGGGTGLEAFRAIRESAIHGKAIAGIEFFYFLS